MDEEIMKQQDINEYIVTRLKEDIAECENYYEAVIKPAVKERYEAYHATEDYYNKKLPNLSKKSKLVSLDVIEVCEWAMPSLMRIFFGSTDSVITIQPVGDEDETSADILSELIRYQIERKNSCYMTLYNFFKDALVVGLGVVKVYWEREEKTRTREEVMSLQALAVLQQNPQIQVLQAEPFDEFGNFKVAYQTSYYAKNNPKLENILISEFLYSPRAKSLGEANFVAHKKVVTLSYLRQKEKEGVYANIDKVADNLKDRVEDDLELYMKDNYSLKTSNIEKSNKEVVLYECYKKFDLNGDEINEDYIIHYCNETIIRIEENPYGRHTFFTVSPIHDPHRIWAKKSYADLIAPIQDIKTALIRQMVINISLSNDPKMILSEEAININDYIEGRAAIRKKPGYQMADVAMPMPTTPLHPWSFQFLEYMEAQKESRTGVTRYNQGLDARSLNKTATGISSIMSASNQRLELIARTFAETGIQEMFRFLITLNQKFIDQETTIRVANKPLKITPDDLAGEFDLMVSSGIQISSREQTMINLQTVMTAILQIVGSGIPVATPSNIYNLLKRWLAEMGIKNSNDYLTDPILAQQRMMLETYMKQQVLASLPPQVVQEYMNTGTLPPEIMMSLPPEIQMILQGGSMFGQGVPDQGSGDGQPSGVNASVSGQLLGDVQRMDNRQPQNVPRKRDQQVAKSPSGT